MDNSSNYFGIESNTSYLIGLQFKIDMKSNKNIDKEIQQEVKFTELPLNIEETIKIQNSPTYTKYKSWLKQNGVIIDPRLRYPSYFGDAPFGVIGISASKPIQKQRAVIAVPYNLLITVDKVKSIPELNSIIINYFTVFGSKDDGAMKILVLFVMSELLKGEKSFYHPYFSICSGSYLNTWSNWTAYKLQHRGVIRDLKSMQEQIERQFMRFLSILRSNSKIFPQDISNGDYRNIFEKAYSIVTTRAFGWSLPSISLIPMADSLNHGNVRFFNHFVTNIDLQKHPQCEEFRFRNKVNLTILKDQYFTLSNEQLGLLRKQFRTKQSKFVQKHKQILIQKQKLQGKQCDKITISKDNFDIRSKQYTILHQQYRAGVHKLKNLHFYESSCSQDNDTDEETIFERETNMQTYELDDYTRNITEGSKKKQVKKLWKLYYQNVQSSEEEEEQQQQSKSLPIIKNNQMKKEIEQKMNKISDSSDMSSEEPDEQDQQFLRFQKANHSNSYFIMNAQEIIRENEQVYNFYGRRSNKFLLLGYNFILKDNIYDSFPFRVKLDEKVNSRVPASKIVDSSPKKQEYLYSRQIRLKKFRINLDLIYICRAYIILWTKKEWKNGRICLPFDREIEQKTLEYYQEIINYLLKQYATSIDQDEEQEQVIKSYEQKLAIGFKIEYKKILLGQLSLTNKCLNFIKKWKVNQIQDFEQSDMIWVKRLKPYLIRLEKASTL